MNKKNWNSSITVLLTLSILFFSLTTTSGAPSDDYRLQVGDWFIIEITVNSVELNHTVGDQYKNIVSEINRSTLNSHIGSVLNVYTYKKSVSSSEFVFYKGDGITLYNATDPTLNSTGGLTYRGDSQFYCGISSCSIFNSSVAYVASQKAYNISSGHTVTSWDGFSNGTGNTVGNIKIIATFESIKFAGSSYNLYNWTGTEWDCIFANRLVDYSWKGGYPDLTLTIALIIIAFFIIWFAVFYALHKKKIIKVRWSLKLIDYP